MSENPKSFWLTVPGILINGIVLTVIVLLESMFAPWAPYFLIYAILAIVFPLFLKTYNFGEFKNIFSKHRNEILIFLGIGFVLDFGLSFTYDTIIASFGLTGNPYYDFNAALVLLADTAAVKFGISSMTAMLIYALYIVFWAPIGEELFYRGYMYGELKEKIGFSNALLVSTFFFGIRHATHFFFLSPTPIIPGLWWSTHAFLYGLVMVYAYEKTESLYVPMLIHFATNFVGVIIQIL